MSYCEFVASGRAHEVHVAYHDTEYGFPLTGDDALFGRLLLEINQAGLSWETILKKRENFARAYDGFSVEKVASYGESDIARLMDDPGIIRNRLKINAAVRNAGAILSLRESHESFGAWLDTHHPRTKSEWVKLFKTRFTFVGGEIVGEFLMSCGYLPGAHDDNCPVAKTIIAHNPPWQRGQGTGYRL